jgi:oligopeptide transport system substrate-binding protein
MHREAVKVGTILRRVSWPMIIVMLFSLFLSACGAPPAAMNATAPAAPEVPAATSAPAGATAAASTGSEPPRGGVYRFLGNGDIASLDAQVACNYEDWWAVGYVMYNRLYSWDQNGTLHPDLAAGMPEVSADGKEYTIKLRQGVTFHNGRELKASDVKFSLERMNTLTNSCWVGSLPNVVGMDALGTPDSPATEASGIVVVDDYTIKFQLKEPQATFVPELTVSGAGIGPKDEILAAGADWGTRIALGTGPFKLQSWNPGEKAVFERNPAYYKQGLPYLDGVEIYERVTEPTQLLRWESGEAEFINAIPPQELGRIFDTPELNAQLRTFDSIQYKRMLFDHTPGRVTADVRVRQAIAMAIDKEAISRFQRGSEPMNTLYTPKITQFSGEFANKWTYNPEAAKQLLAEAGVQPGTKLGIFSGPGKEFGELIQADLNAIGFDTAIYFDKLPREKFEAGEISLLIYGSSPSYPDAFSATSEFACGDSPEPKKGCSTKIDELIAASEVLALDDPQRTANYRQIEEIVINEETLTVPLNRVRVFGLGSAKIKDDFLHPIHTLPILEYAYFVQQ